MWSMKYSMYCLVRRVVVIYLIFTRLNTHYYYSTCNIATWCLGSLDLTFERRSVKRSCDFLNCCESLSAMFTCHLQLIDWYPGLDSVPGASVLLSAAAIWTARPSLPWIEVLHPTDQLFTSGLLVVSKGFTRYFEGFTSLFWRVTSHFMCCFTEDAVLLGLLFAPIHNVIIYIIQYITQCVIFRLLLAPHFHSLESLL